MCSSDLESKIKKIHSRKSHSGPNHAFMYKGETSSSRQPTHAKLPKKKTPIASNDHSISFKTFDASYVLTNKSGKVVAKFVGDKHKGSKTCVWVPKVLVSNAKGPKTIWPLGGFRNQFHHGSLTPVKPEIIKKGVVTGCLLYTSQTPKRGQTLMP